MHRPDGCFHLPQLPKPEYRALRRLCQLLESTQLEAMCVGLRLMADSVNRGDLARLVTELAEFRATAPKEQPPLIQE